MAPVLVGVAVLARRRQRARSAPSGSRRGWQRALGSGRPRGDLRWLGRRRTAPSTLRLSSDGRKAAAGVGHGAAHLLLLVADVRKLPGVRAVQEHGGGDKEQGDIGALSRSTTSSEENDSVLKLFLNFTELDIDNALKVFDRMIRQAEFFFWSWDLVR